jgi:hypothetical protein
MALLDQLADGPAGEEAGTSGDEDGAHDEFLPWDGDVGARAA